MEAAAVEGCPPTISELERNYRATLLDRQIAEALVDYPMMSGAASRVHRGLPRRVHRGRPRSHLGIPDTPRLDAPRGRGGLVQALPGVRQVSAARLSAGSKRRPSRPIRRIRHPPSAQTASRPSASIEQTLMPS